MRVDAAKGGARVTAALPEAQMTVVCEADEKSGCYAVDGKVVRFARTLADEAQAVRRGDKLRITGGTGAYSFAMLAPETVPTLAEPETWVPAKLDANRLHEALNYVRSAAAASDIRYYLNGVLVHLKGDCAEVVATDGHVAARAIEKLPERSANAAVILPNKCVNEIARLLDDPADGVAVETGVRSDDATMLRVRAGPVTYVATGFNASYPAYEQIFARAAPRARASFDADAALAALKRLQFAVQTKAPALRLSVKDSVLTLASALNAEAEGTEAIALDGSVEPFECGVNLYFLEAAVASARGVAKKVTLGWLDHEQPLTVRPRTESGDEAGERSWIVMPCNL